MVLGLGSKKKGQPVKLEFLILIHEIKPWKPVQSAKTPLVLQWQRGDKRSGKSKIVVPDEDGRIVFNESFKLPAKLVREPEGKGKNAGVVKFQKKTVVFNLLEATTDRQLARCIVDLGEFGDADTAVEANSPLSTGKKVVSGGSPSLFFKIGLHGKKEEPRTSISARVSFGSKAAATAPAPAPAKAPAVSSKAAVEPALDEETRKSLVAALMSDEDDDNDSIASFTDDEEDGTSESAPKARASTSKSDVSGSAAKAPSPVSHPSPARPEVSKVSAPPSHPPPSPRRDPPKVSAAPSHPPLSPRPERVSTPPSHPPPPRPDASKVSGPPSHPPPARPDASRASAPPSHPPPTRPETPKASPPKSVAQSAKPDVPKSPPPTSIPSPARGDASKSSQSTPPKRDPGEALRSSASPVEKRADASRATGLFSSGNRSPASSVDSSNNGPKVSKGSSAAAETGTNASRVNKSTKLSAEEQEEELRASLFSSDADSRSSKSSKSSVNAPEPARAPLGLFSSGTTNAAGRGGRSSPTPSEGSRSPLVSKDSSRGSSPSDTKAASEVAGSDIAKASKSEVPAEKDRTQKSSIPLPPASAKAAAAAAATAYAAKNSYRTRGKSYDFTFDSGSSEDSLSPNSNGARSPIQSPLLSAQSGTLHSRSPSYSRTQKTVLPQGPEVSMDAKQPVSQKEEKREESKSIPSKEEGRKSYDRRDEKPETRRSVDLRRDDIGPVKSIPPKRDEFMNDDDGEAVSVLGSAKANLARVEKKALDELRNKVANAEAKLLEANQRAQEQARQLSQQVERLEGELRETGAMEVALYCVVAEHGNSSHKLHTPARRLARLYMHASKQWSPERKAGTAKNCVAGLVTVAKACGTDVSRLSFWWSNVVALRAVIAQAYDTGGPDNSQVGSTDATASTNSNGNGSASWARKSLTSRKSFSRQDSKLLSPKPLPSDWQQPGTFITALEKIEGWIYTKIIESLWWQAMIPRMQKGVDPSAPTSPRGLSILSPAALAEFTNKAKEDFNKMAGDVTGMFVKKHDRTASVSLPELGDARQGNVSVEIWKKAMKDALCRLCPVRGAGHECGCLPMLIKTAIEGCCARLDVALFNAILRDEGDDVPTDPISDPVSDPSVLPISPGGLSFGGGSQLKNVVVTWSTFIHGLVSLKEPTFAPEAENGDSSPEMDDPEKLPKLFNLIKATGDLLMLPKDFLTDRAFRKEEAKREAEKMASVFKVLKTTGDILQLPKEMLMDKSLRREICPMLSLHLVRRILVNFVPDEFAPDPISPSLLAALNAEAAIERQRNGEADESSVAMATAPPVVYPVPSAFYVWSWIGEANSNAATWGRSSNSLLRKGYTSDEDLEVMEQLQENNASSKLDVILGSSRPSSVSTSNGEHSEGIMKSRQSFGEEIGASRRFQLLKPVWGTQ
ncbi:hypothetical protein MPTK1_2g15570 [Marchantia polymorpha subsp. ruderalis]|uniref:C2 NT-type domain-containing protein n=1 Tax=Marchantia polymorpha TaxID=3197 RepID=A0A2R6WK36_MARPO|nr:hypothetical protein MARPO_0082s0054 [Marchantia polymorpha]BBN02463.1 hypothetical protein Mp_2g15570 [Marchantia polymorpha subsp. ruderalis]|eukprot:PTQ34215.1 hypothetical protein MARPO_0082s0054 [Marchantia polymorpha]